MTLNRRTLLASAGAIALPTLPITAFAQGKVEFSLKYANNLPVTHPMNQRANEMAAKNGASMPAMPRLERITLSLVAAAGLACVAVLAVTLG